MATFLVLFSVLFLVGCVSHGRAGRHRKKPSWWLPALAVPTGSQLVEEIEAALDLRVREDFYRALDARDPDELLEHATLTQIAVDRGIFGADAIYVMGEKLFDFEFRPEQGLGNAPAGRPGIRAGSRPLPTIVLSDRHTPIKSAASEKMDRPGTQEHVDAGRVPAVLLVMSVN